MVLGFLFCMQEVSVFCISKVSFLRRKTNITQAPERDSRWAPHSGREDSTRRTGTEAGRGGGRGSWCVWCLRLKKCKGVSHLVGNRQKALFGSECRNSGFRRCPSRSSFIGLHEAALDGILSRFQRRDTSGSRALVSPRQPPINGPAEPLRGQSQQRCLRPEAWRSSGDEPRRVLHAMAAALPPRQG